VKVSIFQPRNKLVSKLIDRYIIIDAYQNDYSNFHCFPNNNHCVGIILNQGLKKIEGNRYHFQLDSNHTYYLNGIYLEPIPELCIDFKPLALEKFGLQVASSIKFELNPFHDQFLKMLHQVAELFKYNINFQSCFVDQMDSLLLNSIEDEIDIDFVALNKEQFDSIDDLMKIFCKSERSLHRFFKENLGVSPHKYLELIRFKNSIQDLKANKKLKNVAYDNDLVDQSHLNKLFKKFSTLSPTDFKHKVTYFDDLVLKI